jgi:hypothetical protein
MRRRAGEGHRYIAEAWWPFNSYPSFLLNILVVGKG